MNIIVALIIFSVVVVIHELGHFLLAKKNGVGVTEFSIGMGPRLITFVKTENGIKGKLFATTKYCETREDWTKRTKYSWKLLPFGGSCMMLGEDETLEDETAFNNKSVYARMSVIFAGPFFNFILAFLLAVIVISMNGYDPAKLAVVEPNMPVSQAGMQVGDEITRFNGEKITLGREVSANLMFHPLTDQPVNITYVRNGEEKTISVNPVLSQNSLGKSAYRVGFSVTNVREKVSTLRALKYSLYEVKYWIKTTVQSIVQLAKGKVKKDEISGPVGIVSYIGDVIDSSKPMGMSVVMTNIFIFSIFLTANLGVMNLLPIPALDGGRLLFLIFEMIRGKPLNQKWEGMVNFVGFVALMMLMVFVMFNDISKLIH